MTNPRAAAPALLLAAMLAGCDSGTPKSGGTPAPNRPVDLTQVQDTCMAKTAKRLKDLDITAVTADQFFELPAGGTTLRVVTPAPVRSDVTRAMALHSAQCAFRKAGASKALVDQLSIPANGEQSGAWTGFTGVWESDLDHGFRAHVVAAPR